MLAFDVEERLLSKFRSDVSYGYGGVGEKPIYILIFTFFSILKFDRCKDSK